MFVLDASATMPFLFEQESDEHSRALEERVFAEGALVPALWYQEVSNTILTAFRRGRISETDMNRHMREFVRYPIEADMSPYSTITNTVFPIARAHNLTVYDATYVELAMRLDIPLASRDSRMRTAATNMGLELLAT